MESGNAGVTNFDGFVAEDWKSRIIDGRATGAAVSPPAWLDASYATLREQVMHPEYPCFFGTMAEKRGEMFYAFVNGKDIRNLPATMQTFAELASLPQYRKNNIAVFFEPDATPLSHDDYHELFWHALQQLHNVDPDPEADQQPEPSHEDWEFSFAGVQMFVVCACPSFSTRHSRNLGPGMVLLFQPRSVFVDTITNKVIGREARNQVRKRLETWDDVSAHPDLGFYGDPGNLEWKQYFLSDENVRAADRCPFLKRQARKSAAPVAAVREAVTAEPEPEPAGPANTSNMPTDKHSNPASATKATAAPAGDLLSVARTYASLPSDKRATFRARLRERGMSGEQLPIVAMHDRTQRFPLSATQERLWFLWQLDQEDASYNLSGALRLEGELHVDKLRAALDHVVNQHDILRTRFEEVDGVAVQIVGDAGYGWTEIDVAQRESLDAQLQALSLAPFDLVHGPVLRVALLRDAAGASWVLHVAMHHIVSDHTSVQLLLEALTRAYAALCSGTALDAERPQIQYGDVAAWQKEWSSDEAGDPHLAYWTKELGGSQPALELPVARKRTGMRAARGARVGVTFDAARTKSLKQLAARHRTTSFTLLLSAYALLLARYSGQKDVRIGVPVAGRSRLETERVIGFFVNTLVIRADLAGAGSFGTLLARLHERVLDAHRHEALPFAQLVDALQPERSVGQTPLFQVMFNHTRAEPRTLDVAGLRISEYANDVPTARFDLVLNAVERGDELRLSFNYAADLFDEAIVAQMLDHYVEILAQVDTATDRPLAQIALSRDRSGEDTVRRTAFAPVGAQFSRRAAMNPLAPALHCEGERIAYGELERWTNRIARRLNRLGVRADERIGLCVERSVALAAGVLGVLKSGAAFVPLDPAYPLERLAAMLDDAGIVRVLVDSTGSERLGELLQGREAIAIADERPTAAQSSTVIEDDAPFDTPIHPEQLAYVIYTSGSTGRPKGVAINHGTLAQHLDDFIATYRIAATDKVLQSSTINFDVALHELLPALLCGGQVEMRGPQLWDPETTSRHLIDERVTFSRIPTAYWQQWLREPPPAESLAALRQITVGGEGLPGDALRQWRSGPLGHIRLDNLYGPTETTIACMYRETRAQDEEQAIVSIGGAYPSRSVQVCDADGNEAPVGALGELCIGGHTLARGYLDRAALTADRFIPDPHGPAGSRLYRTGDLCRRRADGSIDFLGRLDQQVKLRGYRIELGEIEAVLREAPGVQAAAVALRGDGDAKRLVGYVVGDADDAVVRRVLQSRLPGYMVPSALVWLERLPVMQNGKVDRAALPEPAFEAVRAHVAPRTALETSLLAIWQTVLGRDGLSMSDNFFDVGGHSLLMMRVASRIRQELGHDVSLQTLFLHPVLVDLATELAQQHAQTVDAIVPCERTAHIPLTHEQERLWFLWKLEPDSAAYTITGAVNLTGTLDRQAVRVALDGLVARHESLRTRFVEQNAQPSQVIDAAGCYGWREETVAGRDALDARLRALSREPFDLEHGPMLRVALLDHADDQTVLHFAMPHIVSDAWSQAILLREFSQLYRAACGDEAASLASLPIQYADYALWQRTDANIAALDMHYAYWQRELGGEQPLLALPVDRVRQGARGDAGASVGRTIDATLARALDQRAREQGATRFMTLLAAFGTVLQGYSGQHDVRVGVPVAGRDRMETEALIGFFVNTLVIRMTTPRSEPFSALLGEVRERMIGAHAHALAPFAKLVERLQPQRSISHTPLFQAMFNYSAQGQTEIGLPGVAVEMLAGGAGTAQFDVSLHVAVDGDGLKVALNYATDIFERSTAMRLLDSYVAVLEQIARQPEVRAPLLASAGDEGHVAQWSAAPSRYEPFAGVHELFSREAGRHPSAVALVFGEAVLTYGELESRANRLAHFLIQQGVGPEVRVGIGVERSVEMVVGLLAILKAGGAYVPLDPEYPAERLAYMCEDSGIELLLTQHALRERFEAHVAGRCAIVELDTLDASREPSTLPSTTVHPEQLAYVIYTSGSTGRPKGAANRHGALYNRLAWMQQAYALDATDTVLQKTPFSFDVSVWEFFWPLMTGARLAVAAPGDHREPARLVELIDRHQVSTLHFVPPMLQAFVSSLDDEDRCTSLRRVICSGEALPATLQDRTLERLPHVQLYNLYGPTEAAIDVTHWTCHAGDATVPIGRPIGNVTTHVLDASMNRVPVGVAGELYLGGAGLARGYLKRPALTAERFVPDPFIAGSRLYRTGDLARWRTDGALEYLGRLDHQVKVRGFRIELGEIEAALQTLDGVGEAVVVTQMGPGGARLVGYVTARAGATLEPKALESGLKAKLPEYMVPSVWVELEKLPLSPNGKVERRALPAPESAQEQEHEAPQGEVETALAQVWESVLRVGKVSRHANFFELGGDSILSLQIVERARRAGWKVTPRQLFERQTVSQLAGVVQRTEAQTAQNHIAQGEVPLLPIQAQFFEQVQQQRHHWNQAVLLRSSETIDAQVLEQALRALINHHDALRLRFTQDDAGQWIQSYAPVQTQPDLLWIREAKDVAEIEAHSEAAQRSLDLTNGPLLRAVLMRIADGSTRLLLVIHHLVVDGVSWRILLEDLQTASTQIQRGEAAALPARTDSYQRWSQQLQQYAKGDALNNQREYWEQVNRTPSTLPCDTPTGTNRVADRQQATLKLDSTQTQRLLQQAPAAYRTQVNDLLLTALGRALCGWTGQERIRLDLEGHGREDVFEGTEISRTVGWFTSVYPVSLEPAGALGEAVKRVKEGLRAVPQRGLGYGVLSNVAHTIKQTEPSQVIFNYLGQLDGSFSESSTWQPAKEPSGATRDANAPLGYDLTINSQVYAGELSLTIGYSDKRYTEQTIDALLAAYRNELTQLIDHCTSGATDATGVTPSDFPLSGLDAAQLDRLALPWAQIDDLYPATPLQGGLLFHSLLKTGRGVYVNQRRLTLRGPLDSAVLQAVWETLIARHGILRTGFVWAHGGDALQVVYKRIATPYAQHDWSASTQTEYDARIADWLRDDLARGFDPADAPLLRINLFVRPDGEHDLVWTDHHVLMDGWSAAQLFGEMLHLYRTRIAGEASRLSAAGSYRDYVAWLAQQGDPQPWWDAQRARLDDPATLTGSLPAPSAEVAQRESRVIQQDVRLDAGFTARLQHTAQRYRVTLNTLIQGAWAILLARYGHRDQAVFGATLSGRENDLPGIERMLGLFINSLPVWVGVPASAALDDWLESLQHLNTELRAREATPLTRVQQWVGRSGDALFDSLLVFENYPVDEAMRNGDTGLTLTARAAVESTHYPMVLAILPGEQLGLRWKYRSTRFDASTVEQLSGAYRSILEQLTDTATVHVGDIVLPQAKPTAHATQHSTAAHPFRAIAERVSAQAALHPQREALHCEGTRTTYGELDAWANRIGRRLARLGVRADERVGLCIERSAGMVAGLLGVLKAGAAFVPLDPAYPAERLTYMMEDAGVTRVLADAATAAQLATLLREREVVVVSELDDESSEPFSMPVHPDQLAYVIYTSGSTGRPKGVAISHRSLSLHLDDFLGTYRITENDKQLQSSTINFDVALHEMLPALSSGGKVEMRGPQQWDLDTTSRHLADEGVTFSRIPTAYWQQWLRNPPAASALAKLRQITVGGEGLPGDALRQWRNGPLGHIRLDNLYGPTETTVACMYRETRAQDEDQAIVSIGDAYPSRRAYVIDRSGHEAPIDGLGELCIAGATLARGYLDRPAATAEKFIPDPFSNDGGRLYRTGDLCRRRADGRIDFLGRLDQQVKLRGLRIELGEIEAALREVAGVRDAVVALNGEGDGKRLVGYVVGTADETAVRGALESRLPAHMVPSVFMHLDALPVMPNGKVDRAALPAPMAQAGERVMPDTSLETQLLAVWNDVLKRDDLGVTDDFFAVGGHSLLALKVLAKAAQTGLPGVTLEALFQHPSVRTLAAHLATQAHADTTQATPAANVVSMSERTDAPMVFAIHPASGLVADYRPLAAALDGVASVYGVQAPFYTEDWWPGDLSQLAADYAARIRTVQPRGPYRLIGWSVGGVIATEVARVLARDGGEVPFVGLIDAHVLSPDDANHAHATDDDKDAARYDAAPVTYEQMQTYRAADHELQKVLDDAGRKWPAMKGELSDAGTRALLSKVMLFQRHLGHIVRYTEHTPLPVDLKLWWARHRPHRPAREATAMWAARATGSVSVANEIDADHTHIVRHSDLFDDLARALASSTAHDNRPEHLS